MRSTVALACAITSVLAIGSWAAVPAASADAICEVPLHEVFEEGSEEGEEVCGLAYPTEEKVEGEATEAVLQAGELTIACESTFTGKTEKDLGEGSGLEGRMATLSFTSCEGTCTTVKTVNLEYKALLKATEGGDATLVLSSGGSGEPRVELTSCFGGITCTYSAKELNLDVLGGEPATVAALKEPTTKTAGSFFCPSSGSFSATYVLAQPPAGFPARRVIKPVVLCKAQQATCAAGNQWTPPTTLTAVTSSTPPPNGTRAKITFFLTEGGVPQEKFQECKSEIQGKTENLIPPRAPLRGEITVLKTEACAGPCSVTTGSRQPFEMKIEANDPVSGHGNMIIDSLAKGPPDITFGCGGTGCNYEAAFFPTISGGNPRGFINLNAILARQNPGSEPNCSATATLQGQYEITAPAPMFVSRLP